jgi:hypothetical protein
MFARALIVVLLALNLGVAAWWLLGPAAPVPSPPVSDQGGAHLELLPVPAAAAPAATPAVASAVGAASDVAAAAALLAAATTDADGTAPATTTPTAPATCLRLGPFQDRDAAQVAQVGLGALLRDAAIQEEVAEATGYRVLLPAQPDAARAQAIADRIAAAGFQDFLILRQGEDANGIALGNYRSRETADRRAAALREAGFPAEVRAQGASAASRWWLDGATTDASAVRAAFPATQDRACASR